MKFKYVQLKKQAIHSVFITQIKFIIYFIA